MRRRQPLKSNKLKKWLAAPYAVLGCRFHHHPADPDSLLCVHRGRRRLYPFEFRLRLRRPENIKALGLALWLSLLSTALCLFACLSACHDPEQNRNVNQTSFIVLIFILPMWMNFLLRTLAWQTLLEKNGVINSVLAFFASARHLPSSIRRERSFSVWCTTSCRLWCCRSTMF